MTAVAVISDRGARSRCGGHGPVILARRAGVKQTSRRWSCATAAMFCGPHSPNDPEDEGDQYDDPEHRVERSVSAVTPTAQHIALPKSPVEPLRCPSKVVEGGA